MESDAGTKAPSCSITIYVINPSPRASGKAVWAESKQEAIVEFKGD